MPPLHEKRKKMIPEFGIHQTLDYLTYTIKPKEIMSVFGMFPSSVIWQDRGRGFNGYTHAWQSTNVAGAMIGVNPHRRDMGVHVVLPGKALASLREMGVKEEFVDDLVGEGGDIRRFDVAIDVISPTDEIKRVRDLVDRNEYDSNKKPLVTYTPEKGKTVQFDFKDLSVVMYDKLHEQRETFAGLHWNRFEVRIKGKRATGIWKSRSWCRAAKSKVDIPLSVGYYQAIGNERGDFVWSNIKTESNTLKWLLTDVVTALAKETVKNEATLSMFLVELNKQIDLLKENVYNSVQIEK